MREVAIGFMGMFFNANKSKIIRGRFVFEHGFDLRVAIGIVGVVNGLCFEFDRVGIFPRKKSDDVYACVIAIELERNNTFFLRI